MKRRLVIAVTCVPIPPDFLDLPLRQMMLPFIGRLPVSSQIFAIKSLSQKRSREHTSENFPCKPLSERFGCSFANSENVRDSFIEHDFIPDVYDRFGRIPMFTASAPGETPGRSLVFDPIFSRVGFCHNVGESKKRLRER